MRLTSWIEGSLWRFTFRKCLSNQLIPLTMLNHFILVAEKRLWTPHSNAVFWHFPLEGYTHSDCVTVRQGAERLHGKCSTKVYEPTAPRLLHRYFRGECLALRKYQPLMSMRRALRVCLLLEQTLIFTSVDHWSYCLSLSLMSFPFFISSISLPHGSELKGVTVHTL
jgi:hypothetical protein